VPSTPTGNIIVAGAGTVEVNGVYTPSGDIYVKSPNLEIRETGLGNGLWVINVNGLERYVAASGAATPDLVVTWLTTGGIAPTPTVTAELGLI
jgi:hypothetical protein